MSALGDIDDGQNRVLDVNSLMTALEGLSQKSERIQIRVPINYYLKDITIGMLAEMWVAKYFFGKYIVIPNDDTEPTKKSGDSTASANP